jgi:hypothetical protein
MTNKTPTDPFEMLQMSKDWLTAQQKFLPSDRIFERIAESVSAVTQANIVYGQAMMRAQASLLSAFVDRAAAGAEDNDTTGTAPHK